MTTRLIFAAIIVLVLALLFSQMSLGGLSENMSILPPVPSLLPRSFVGTPNSPIGSDAVLPGGVSRVLTLHFAPWCGACTNYRPTWEAMKRNTAIIGLSFQENNEEANPTPGITSYPTITALDEWGRTHVFRGDRDTQRVLAWVSAPVIVG